MRRILLIVLLVVGDFLLSSLLYNSPQIKPATYRKLFVLFHVLVIGLIAFTLIHH